MTPALIALGGNVGDARAAFAAALAGLRGRRDVADIVASRAYRTPAVGANAGGEFLNAAATFRTGLSARDLLAELHRLEAAAGRRRQTRWAPRTLDLDLILYGAGRIESGGLTVPHPAFGWRRFVLDPACEIAAGWPVPGGGTVGALRASLLTRPLPVRVETGDAAFFDELAAALGPAFPVRLMRNTGEDDPPPALRVAPGDAGRPGDPRVVRVPADADGAVAALRDILAAALPDPEPAPAPS